MAYLPLLLLISAALFSGLTVLFILFTIHSRREHQNTIFPIVRETEGVKARRYAIASTAFLILAALSIGGWIATQQDPANILQARKATQQALSPQTLSALTPLIKTTPNISAPPSPESKIAPGQVKPSLFSEAPTNTPQIINSTLIISIEATHSPTQTPPIDSEPAPTTTPAPEQKASPIPIPGGMSMGPIVFAADVNDKREAQNPSDVFDIRTGKIYAVFSYQGMENGLSFSVIWYYQNIEIVRDEFEWNWGSEGQSYFFIKPRNSGLYNVEFKIGNDVVAKASFEVTP